MLKYSLLILVLIVASCGGKRDTLSKEDFLKEQEDWRGRRFASLSKPYGWLSLTGLLWLEDGVNSFGAGPDNDIVFPSDTAPERMGEIIVNGKTVSIKILDDIDVFADGKNIKALNLVADDETGKTYLTWGPLLWYLVERDGRFGIRLKDSTNSILANFKGTDFYPPEQKWKIPARFEKYSPPKDIAVPNILGQTNNDKSPGALVFKVKGIEYRLDLLDTTYEGHYFLIFADKTNGHETYGAGRFAYIPKEDEAGWTTLDFNKAYSPPCIFTPFATCPIPPMQNRLPIEVKAGEKSTGYTFHF